MANKMLIDATHSEETRVVVVRGNRVEEFDFESASRKPLRGNIYLAKVTRVEPSLQAAFVDYGGNRHGFLAFNEIHPDYYQIPLADRQALLDAEAEAEAEEERAAERAAQRAERAAKARTRARAETAAAGDAVAAEVTEGEGGADEAAQFASTETEASAEAFPPAPTSPHDDHGEEEHGEEIAEEVVESVGAEDALEEVPERRPQRARRTYKIQEVIKRRQVLLVQVVKEERGNKGAALTTYLSLAGRYSVLMPNTARGGGISRKITSAPDRKRLKKIATELEVPEGMGVILRTAGANRTKVEVKRDFEYLLRLWENVRDLTLRSSAPALVYEEGSLIKRSIRDLYNKDIDEVLVGGDDGYREAKDFMRMLMPSHAKNVKAYKDPSPLFTRFGVEAQLDAMFSPQVTLKSGGYIVINQTEALVSIDVNSGRSTREHNIEDTALQTNLEASDEVARQLRLRDLAGLIVIDFIDMEENKNNRAVERRLKEALKSDRARIQVGRISHFGLMEMSRQRIRTGVVESSTQLCPHCFGTGLVRSTESVALHVLRSIEEALIKNAAYNLDVRTRTAVALYILNQKRRHLADIEARFGVQISLTADETLGNLHHVIERGELAVRDPGAPLPPALAAAVHVDTPEPEIEPEEEEEADIAEAGDEPAASSAASADAGDSNRKRRRRRRRRRNGEAGQDNDASAAENGEDSDDGAAEAEAGNDETETAVTEVEATETEAETSAAGEAGEDDAGNGRRRRGRRGGRRRREAEAAAHPEGGEEGDATAPEAPTGEPAAEDAAVSHEAVSEEAPAEAGTESPSPVWETWAPISHEGSEVVQEAGESTAPAEPVAVETIAEPEAGDVPAAPVAVIAPAEDAFLPEAGEVTATEDHGIEVTTEQETVAPEETTGADGDATQGGLLQAAETVSEEDDDRPKRTGWWQRRGFL